MDVPGSPPSQSCRPSCTVAESTSGLAAVCPAPPESVSVISPVVSPAQLAVAHLLPLRLSSLLLLRVFVRLLLRLFLDLLLHVFVRLLLRLLPVRFRLFVLLSTRRFACRPCSLGTLRSPFCPPLFALARFVVLHPVLVPCQFGFVLSFLPTLC